MGECYIGAVGSVETLQSMSSAGLTGWKGFQWGLFRSPAKCDSNGGSYIPLPNLIRMEAGCSVPLPNVIPMEVISCPCQM